jgi:pimeloyl-ACP methyl ester carboxylesterase
VNVVSGYSEVNGTKLYYEVAGQGEAIVLIHGNGGDFRHWDNQFKPFSEDYRVLRYDIRGFGRSNMPIEGEPYSHSDDIKAIMKFHDLSQAHILGMSLGSGIATDFILKYPELSKSYVAIGPYAFGYSSPDHVAMFQKISSILESEGEKEAMSYLIDEVFVREDTRKRIKEIGVDYSWWHFRHNDPAIYFSPPAIDQLEYILVPTLVLLTENEYPPCAEIGEMMVEMIPENSKVVISGADHGSFPTHSEEFNKHVLDFLSSL